MAKSTQRGCTERQNTASFGVVATGGTYSYHCLLALNSITDYLSMHSNKDEVISARSAHVGFVVNKVTLQVFLPTLVLNDIKERRILRKFKEEALDRAVWRRGCGPDVSRTVRYPAQCRSSNAACSFTYRQQCINLANYTGVPQHTTPSPSNEPIEFKQFHFRLCFAPFCSLSSRTVEKEKSVSGMNSRMG